MCNHLQKKKMKAPSSYVDVVKQKNNHTLIGANAVPIKRQFISQKFHSVQDQIQAQSSVPITNVFQHLSHNLNLQSRNSAFDLLEFPKVSGFYRLSHPHPNKRDSPKLAISKANSTSRKQLHLPNFGQTSRHHGSSGLNLAHM